MAALIQTGTLVNGEWITTAVDLSTVLERNKEQKEEESDEEVEIIPALGVMSQTVVESPVIRWIIPARIRSGSFNDCVFIGDNYVHVRHLGSNHQLHEVARKTDLGSRIRNAHIIGGSFRTSASVTSVGSGDDGDVVMNDAPITWLVPAHYILLALESQELVFLHLQNVDWDPKFVVAREKTSNRLRRAGAHLAVDPSARYVAVGGSGTVFSIYALHPRETLNTQCRQGQPFSPVHAVRHMALRAPLYRLEFLYPAANDPDHVILLVLTHRAGITSMIIYQWIAGQDLREIDSWSKRGHPLPYGTGADYRLPPMIIPLLFQSQFLMVFPDRIVRCHSFLSETPKFSPAKLAKSHNSLPAAWARPVRNPGHQCDDIYLAREDGSIQYITTSFGPDTMGAEFSISPIGTLNQENIGTAFACLGGETDDILVAGGQESSCCLYMVTARNNPYQMEWIVTWAPTTDFVVTPRLAGKKAEYNAQKEHESQVDTPQRIFTCSGTGGRGAISQLRYGHEARITMEAPDLEHPVSGAWGLSLSLSGEGPSTVVSSTPLLFLLSYANTSVLLHHNGDGETMQAIDANSTWLDLDSRTITAVSIGGATIQVTERSINCIAGTPLKRQKAPAWSAFCRKIYGPERTITAAAFLDSHVALIAHEEGGAQFLTTWEINWRFGTSGVPQPDIQQIGPPVQLVNYPEQLSVVRQSNGAIYGIVCGNDHSNEIQRIPKWSTYRIVTGTGLQEADMSGAFSYFNGAGLSEKIYGTCTGIAHLQSPQSGANQRQLLLTGYRNGFLLMVIHEVTSTGAFKEVKISRNSIGSTAVSVMQDPTLKDTALVHCGSKLWRITFDPRLRADPSLHRVWFTIDYNTWRKQPLLDYVAYTPQGILVIDEKKLLLAMVDQTPKTVPWMMCLQGAPRRLIHSQALDVLILGLSTSSRSTLSIFDPNMGVFLDQYCDPHGKLLEYPHGLGVFDDKVLAISEWAGTGASTCNENLLIVGTSKGNLVLYRLDEQLDEQAVRHNNPTGRRIRCRGLDEAHYSDQVAAVVTCTRTFLVCVGKQIFWMSLDPSERKLVTHAQYTLPSEATSLSVDGNWLNVSTTRHSLVSLLLADKTQYPQIAESHGQFLLHLEDEVDRQGLDHLIVRDGIHKEDVSDSMLTLVSDTDCAVSGLWGRKRVQQLGASFTTLFEASIPHVVVKLRLGHTRPWWDAEVGVLRTEGVAGALGSDILGLGIDGSITRFTLLDKPLCRLLHFLQDLITADGPTALTSLMNAGDPRKMHVNGDILKPYRYEGSLEKLLQSRDNGSPSDVDDSVTQMFCRLMTDVTDSHAVDDNVPSRSLQICLGDAYLYLEHLLHPAR